MATRLETGQRNRNNRGAPVPVVASPRLTAALQQLLTDLIELHLQGKQAHWNVVGHNFRDLHLQLDEIVGQAREFSDTVAERMRSLHAFPDGRSDTVVTSTRLPPIPPGEHSTQDIATLIGERLYAVVGTAREIHSDVDGEDPASADVLHAVIQELEKSAWMLASENRRP